MNKIRFEVDEKDMTTISEIISRNVAEAEQDHWENEISSYFAEKDDNLVLRVSGPDYVSETGSDDCYFYDVSILEAAEDFAEEEAAFSIEQREELTHNISLLRKLADGINAAADKAEARLNDSTT